MLDVGSLSHSLGCLFSEAGRLCERVCMQAAARGLQPQKLPARPSRETGDGTEDGGYGLTKGSPGGLCLAEGDGLQQRHWLAKACDAIAGQPKAGGERHVLQRHRMVSCLGLIVFRLLHHTP